MSIIPGRPTERNTPARYNIAPTQDVLFLATGEDGLTVKEGRWWLVPFWAEEIPKYSLFNARSEDAHKKPSFRDAFKSKRCLVFGDGFYEWTKNPEDEGRDPHHIHLPDQEPFGFAGLWAHNDALDITSCTILTATADPAIEHIHNRMPIILQPDVYEQWIDPETSVDDARDLLTKHRGGQLQSFRVGRKVNSSKTEGPELIEPLSP